MLLRCRRSVLFLIRNPLLLGTGPRISRFTPLNEPHHLCALNYWRQLSQHPEGSRSNWTDDVRAEADADVRTINRHGRGEEGKEGTSKAIQSGLELGEIAKRTMDVAWESAWDSGNNIKDAITGDDHHHSESAESDARFKKPDAGGGPSGYHFKH